MAHIQQQIRENSMELQDYLRELRDWESKVKAKDQMLKGSAAPSSAAPPVRGQLKAQLNSKSIPPTEVESTTKPKSEEKKEDVGKKEKGKSAAGHTYDYFRDKWDKFDLDKALAEADEDLSQPDSVPRVSTQNPVKADPPITSPAAVPVPQTEKQAKSKFAFPNGTAQKQSASLEELPPEKTPDALSEKEEGNRLFKAGRYREAFEAYSRSLALAPTSVAYANRAMAALKLERFEEAVRDCTAAIDLDCNYVKAYTRRGKSYSRLGRWLQAANDFEFALRLEPHNLELLQEYTATRAGCQKEAKLSAPLKGVRLPIQKNVPSPKQPPAKVDAIASKNGADSPSEAKGLVKERMREVTSKKVEGAPGASLEATTNGASSVWQSKSRESVNGSLQLDEAVGVESKRTRDSKADSRVSPQGEASPMRRIKIEEDVSQTEKKGVIGSVSGKVTPCNKETESKAGAKQKEISIDSPSRLEKVQKAEKVNGVPDAAMLAAERLQRALAENVTPPRYAYEFEAQWKGFKDDSAAKAKLLKTLPLSSLAAFFKESLQAPLLCDMLRVVSTEVLPSDAAFAADLLEKLTEVPRFGMTVMFITSKDKASLRSLWEDQAKNASIPAEIQDRLALCRKKYRM